MALVAQQTKDQSPKVSVAMITYNHEQFIAQAIESVLMQETNFPVELVIGEDCSTDDTRRIVREYAAKFPNAIRALLPERNLGMQRNFAAVLNSCRGQYIANLEGDDVWTSPEKLEIQARYLDQHQDCVLCHHRVVHFKNNQEEVVREFPPPGKRLARATGEMLASGNFIATCSLAFRSTALPPLGEEFWKLKLGDWPLCVMLAQRGWIGYVDQKMAAYRLHDTSAWSAQSDTFRNLAMIDMVRFLANNLDRQYRGPWVVKFLENESAKLLSQSRRESLSVIARASLNLVKNGVNLRMRKVPRLVYRVGKALAFFCQRRLVSPSRF